MEKTKIDLTVEILVKWNRKQIKDKEALLQLFEIHKSYCLAEMQEKIRRCKQCGNVMPKERISFCSTSCNIESKKNKEVVNSSQAKRHVKNCKGANWMQESSFDWTSTDGTPW